MENPNFYAVIPADVRYSELIPNAKLLYGEITALCNKKGYCYASNSYFAGLYKVSIRQVTTWVQQLQDYGFITIEIDTNSGNTRHISIVKKTSIPIEENFHTYRRKLPYPIEENFLHNNTLNNTLNNNNNNNNMENEEIIDNVDDLRKFLNKGKLQDDYFYKIGDEESFERYTSDFFIFCDENHRIMKKKSIEAKFRAYLKPKYETEEDIKEMKNAYFRKSQRISLFKPIAEDLEMETNKEKLKQDMIEAEEKEKILSNEEKENIEKETKEEMKRIFKGIKVHPMTERRMYLKKVLLYKK